jgi:carboxyl-terminal processing protease
MKKLEGSVGTPITLSISRDNIKEVRHIKMIRDVISSESIHSFLPEPGYGYIRITNFLERTSDDFKDALKKMESGNVSLKGLVLDLRDNPGGLLNQTIQISDIFLERGIILSINGRLKKHTKVFKASPTEKKRDYSVIALINKGSASASEILAGSLQDHNQAIILGTTSFGKGTVQTLERLRDGYGLKLTVGHYFTPNGRDVTEQGIVPDIILDEQELSEYEHFQGDLNEDAWIKKAFEILKSGLKEVSSN